MVQPEEQPSNLRVNESPSVTSKLEFRNEGLAATMATKAEIAAKEYFILTVAKVRKL